MRSICWLNSSLRFEDNRIIFKAIEQSSEVFLIANLDSNEEEFRNKLIYCSIQDLPEKDFLNVTHGDTAQVFRFLLDFLNPDAVFIAKRFDWKGENENNLIKSICRHKNVRCIEVFDNFLVDFREIPLKRRFSDFFRIWLPSVDAKEVRFDERSLRNKLLRIEKGALPFKVKEELKTIEPAISRFSLREVMKRIENFDFKNYQKFRDRLDLEGTTRLSTFINLGIVSIRKIFNIAAGNIEFIRQLCWREYFYNLKHHFPDMNKLELNEKIRNLPWNRDFKAFEAFVDAKTDYPIIDAAVRQLLKEKWIPNRARMILASFFTKDLLLDWRLGEEFFGKHLIDYDGVLNSGNWQWVASVGADARPLRIFNPVLQAKKFDPEAKYIKKYIPELAELEPNILHDPIKYEIPSYPRPIVDHRLAAASFKDAYLRRWA